MSSTYENKMGWGQRWEFAHQFSEQMARLFAKNWANEGFAQKNECFAHFWWATWAIRSRSHIFDEQSERIATVAHFWWATWAIRCNSRSFVMSSLNNSLKAAHFSCAIWVNCSQLLIFSKWAMSEWANSQPWLGIRKLKSAIKILQIFRITFCSLLGFCSRNFSCYLCLSFVCFCVCFLLWIFCLIYVYIRLKSNANISILMSLALFFIFALQKPCLRPYV